MKNIKKIISVLTAAQLLTLAFAPCTFAADGVGSLDDIVLEDAYSENISLPTKTADGSVIEWGSSDTSAAFISDGTAYVLPGIGEKKVTLTAKTANEKKNFDISIDAFEYSGTPIFEEDFELGEGEAIDEGIWRPDSSQIPNTSDQNGANYMGIADDTSDESNHIYMIKRTDNSSDGAKKSYVHLNIPSLPSSSRIIYEADVRMQEQTKNSSGNNIFANYWLCTVAGSEVGRYSAEAAGYVGGSDGIQIKEPAGTLSASADSALQTWSNIKFDVTSANGVFDAYVDNEQVADGYKSRNASASSFPHIAYGLDGNTTGELWLDNVRVYLCPKEAETVLEGIEPSAEDANAVKGNITVPEIEGVTWVSSDPDVLSNNGTVNRDNVEGISETVKLYGMVSDCGMVSAKEYSFTILSSDADDSDEAKALEELTIPDTFTTSVDLPQNSGTVAFKWTSDNENAVFINNGRAYVAPNFVPAKVTLTATVQTPSGPLSKEFAVKVSPSISGTPFVDEDFETTELGALPNTDIEEGKMWNRRNTGDTFGISAESDTNGNHVLRLKAGEYAVLFFDGATPYTKTYITYSTKTEGNPIANIFIRDGRDTTPKGGHQIVNLLEGLHSGNNKFRMQAASDTDYMIDNDTWYDVVLEIDNQAPSVRFFVKKSDDPDYTLVKEDAPYQNYTPKKLVMGFDSGAGAIVFDNFKFYGSNAADNEMEAMLDSAMSTAFVKSDDSYIANNNITLPTIDGYSIIWRSADESIITNDGVVTKPDTGYAHTTLRAVVTDGSDNAVLNKVYNISVAPKLADDEAVKADADALNVSGIIMDSSIAEMVSTGMNGSTIEWTSSHPEIIAADGTVTRPAEDTVVDLTAVVSKGSERQTRSFTVLAAKAMEQDKTETMSDAYVTVRKGRGVSWKTNIIIDPTGDTANDRHGYIVFRADPNAFDGMDVRYSLKLPRTASDGDETSTIEVHAIPNEMIPYIDNTLDYEMAQATGLYDVDNIIAKPTLTRGADNYVDVTEYVKSQLNDISIPKNEDGTVDVAFKLSHCTGKAIIIEGTAALIEERSFAESNVSVRVLDENGNEITVSDGTAEAKANIFRNDLNGLKTLYLAVYDDEGTIIKLVSEDADVGTMGDTAEVSVAADAGTGNTVKAFFWDDRMVPVK